MDKLLFGTAGIPLSTPNRNTLSGISQVKKLGLGCMELEFVRQININEEKALMVKEKRKKEGIVLTCHAPYYINLNSKEKSKIQASVDRIIKSAKIASLCGAYSVAFHPGYYGKVNKESTYKSIKEQLKRIMDELKKQDVKIWVRPETTGKITAFGDFQECVKLSKEIEGVLPCIDFAHLHSRSNGKINSYKEIIGLLTYYEEELGKDALKNMHIHFSGINYTNKGERNHLNLTDSDENYKEIIKAWKDFKICGCVISESPNIEKDAVLMSKIYNKI